MKRDKEDIELKRLLQEQLPKASENPWFTRKVINRLPEHRKSYAWIEYLAYFVGGIICGLCWKSFVSGFNFNVITVGEVLKYVVLTCASLGLVLAFTYRALIKD